jgi:hypothetical protein
MNQKFFNMLRVLLISLLAGLLPYAQADIVSTVNPILAVKSLAKQNPDKVPAIAASFAKRFPEAASDIAATLAKEFPDQAVEIARAVAQALSPSSTVDIVSTVAQAVPKSADEMANILTQEISGKTSDIIRTTTIDVPDTTPPEEDFFEFPQLMTVERPNLGRGGGSSSCMATCKSAVCTNLEPCNPKSPNTLTDVCPDTVPCTNAYCTSFCADRQPL